MAGTVFHKWESINFPNRYHWERRKKQPILSPLYQLLILQFHHPLHERDSALFPLWCAVSRVEGCTAWHVTPELFFWTGQYRHLYRYSPDPVITLFQCLIACLNVLLLQRRKTKRKTKEMRTPLILCRVGKRKKMVLFPSSPCMTITSCMVPSSYSSPNPVLPPPTILGGNPLFGRLVLDTLISVEHEKADRRTTACFEKCSMLFMWRNESSCLIVKVGL